MDLDNERAEIIEHLRGCEAALLKALEGLTEDQMMQPTIDGWSVRDHLTHLAFWHELRASEILRVTAGYQHAWPLTVDSQVVNDIVQPARSHFTLAQARWEYESAIKKVVDAVAVANERGLQQEHYGEVGLRPTHDLAHADFIGNWRKKLDI